MTAKLQTYRRQCQCKQLAVTVANGRILCASCLLVYKEAGHDTFIISEPFLEKQCQTTPALDCESMGVLSLNPKLC